MGKKGSWFSALKRAFTVSSKDKSSEKRKAREKTKWGVGGSNHGEINSFIPLYREPSSIEKILGDAEREQQHKVVGDDEREQHHKVQQAPPKNAQRLKMPRSKPVVTPNRAQVSAIKIQAAYRGHMARRSYRALKGLVRLQGVMRGQSVKRQTMNTMRCMQLLVRVQSQIRTRRLQMMESRSLQQHRSDKEVESSLSKWSLTHQSEAEGHEEWDDSVLTKAEMDERMQRKVEAVIKRERALAYAYSHQLLKVTPTSAHAVMSDIRSGGYPWWWNWLERHLPPQPQPQPAARPLKPTTPKPAATAAPLRPASSRSKPTRSTYDHLDASTPRSSKPLPSPRPSHPTHSSQRWQQPHPKLAADVNLRDDESLTSCPAYTAPRYMAPTASAKAKVRSHGDPEYGPGREGKRRFPFGLGTSIGSLRWGKVSGPLFAAKDSGPQRTPAARHKSTRSIGGLSVDSTVSLPVGVGRKPFR